MLLLKFIDKQENFVGSIFVKRVPNVGELVRFDRDLTRTYKVVNILHIYEENHSYDLDRINVVVELI